jgi:uncharacterized membrane protein YfcA
VEIYVLFFVATIVAGAINSLAGGGGLVTFTLLMLVVPPVTADATSAVALLTAYPTAVWGTRAQLAEVPRRWIWLLLIPSVLGGLLGALLLRSSGDRNFVVSVPWLVLIATLLILLRPKLVPQSSSSDHRQPHLSPVLQAVAVVSVFLVALYGGYFGAGIGILMISALSLMRLGEIRSVVALKNLLTGCLRGVAVVALVAEGLVDWRYGLPMAVGGLVGGYLGGMMSRRANRAVVRWSVIGIGFAVAAYYFWRLYGPPVMHVVGE